MGYQTDFVGLLQVYPRLNTEEIAWINEMSGRFSPGSAGGTLIQRRTKTERASFAESIEPRGWSNWATCDRGCCLTYDGGDKANHMVPWLEHLLAVYLRPGAEAQGEPGFEEFTFDHIIDGMVVGSRRDNGELYAIKVEENEVEIEMLWPGVPEWSCYEPLPYRVKIDKWREWKAARRQQLARDEARDEVGEWGLRW